MVSHILQLAPQSISFALGLMHAIEIFGGGGGVTSTQRDSLLPVSLTAVLVLCSAILSIPPFRLTSTATGPFYTFFPHHVSFTLNLWFAYRIVTIAPESPSPLSWNVMASNTGHGSSPSTVDRPRTEEGDATIISNALTSVAVSYFFSSPD